MGNGTNKAIKTTCTIGIVAEPYEEENASGLAYAILEQIQGLQTSDTRSEFIIYSTKPFKKDRLGAGSKNILIPKSFFGKNIWFWKQEKELLPGILIFNMPLLPFVLPKKIKTVPIFYELMYEAEGAGFLKGFLDIIRRIFVRMALDRAVKVVVPSQATYEDLQKKYLLSSDKIVLSAIGYRVFNGDPDKKVVPENPFFLYVGRIKDKKNVYRMVEAFCDFKDELKTNHVFLIAGKHGGVYTDKILALAEARGYKNDIRFLGYVTDSELQALYVHAQALVFCTIQEGFGMPVLEAMHIGTPVITSNKSSLFEIAHDAALCISPEDTRAIAQAMKDISSDRSLRDILVSKGKERASLYSWQKHTQHLKDILETL